MAGGMVGSVLMDRMRPRATFDPHRAGVLLTSNAGGAARDGEERKTLKDAYDIEALKRCEIIITSQGGDYTTEVFPKLRARRLEGHWIDAASTLRG